MNIKNFHNLEILSVRDNDIESIPDSIESLSKIHELHLQVRIKKMLVGYIYFTGESAPPVTARIWTPQR